MSSDYIARLRAELLRAGAAAPVPRRRRVLRPLGMTAGAALAAAAAVAVLLVIVAGGGTDERSVTTSETVTLSYVVEPASAAEATARVMRERLAEAPVGGAQVSVAGDRLTITAPDGAREEVTTLTAPGRLAMYDWEGSVLGPDGKPAPGDERVTGGQNAGVAGVITEREAAQRGRPVRARNGGGWYALGSAPALSNAHVASAAVGADPVTREPVVTLEFTPLGQTTFTRLTRELARQGKAAGAWQHLAIAIDDRLVSVPYIDYEQAPDGIDGAAGGHISDEFTPETAHELAVILNTGPLPGELHTWR